MYNVLKSRRFWTFIVTSIVDIATLVAAHYVQDPFAFELATAIVGFVSGVGVILIAGYTVDDVTSNLAAIKAGSHPMFK